MPQLTLREGIFLQRIDEDGRRPWSRDGRQPPEWIHRWHSPAGVVADGVGGVITFWESGDNATVDFLAQRYDARGAPLWTPAGVAVTETGCPPRGCAYGRTPYGVVGDGAGGAFFFWMSTFDSEPLRLFVQRIDAAGNRRLGPFGTEVTLADDAPQFPQFHPDGIGGVFVVYEQSAPADAVTHRVRHISADGRQSWDPAVEVGSNMFRRPWDRLATDFSSCLTSDGGIVIAWVDERPTEDLYVDVYAQKISSTGEALWAPGGEAVSTRLWGQLSPAVACDESAGAFVFFEDTLTDDEGVPVDLGIVAQHLSHAGERLWPSDGIRIDSPGNGYGFWPAAVSDARGGAIVVWDAFGLPPYTDEHREMAVRAQRVLPDGSVAWGELGIEIRRRPIRTTEGWGATTQTLGDGASGVNVVFAVEEGAGRMRSNLHAQRLNDAIEPERPPFLLVHREGIGRGVVAARSGEIDCGLGCGNVIPGGGTSLVATPDHGSVFAGWSGDCVGTGECTVAPDGDHFVVAEFRRAADRIGVFRPSQGAWFVDLDGNGRWDGCEKDGCRWPYGVPGDSPVVGDWTGSGFSALGVSRPSAGYWFLDFDGTNSWGGCAADGCMGPFGLRGDVPMAGDWNGLGVSAVGVFRPESGHWFLDANANGDWDGCQIDHCLGPFGLKSDLPVAGEWHDDEKTRLGVFRPSNGYWFLDGENRNGVFDGCTLDHCLGPFGVRGDRPVVGDWTGQGKDSIGVFRPSTGTWYLDLDGNGQWGGCAVDGCLGPFGLASDVPIVGRW